MPIKLKDIEKGERKVSEKKAALTELEKTIMDREKEVEDRATKVEELKEAFARKEAALA